MASSAALDMAYYCSSSASSSSSSSASIIELLPLRGCRTFIASLPFPRTRPRPRPLHHFPFLRYNPVPATRSRSSPSFLALASSPQQLSHAPSISLPEDLSNVPASAGIYAVYDRTGDLQFIGLTRRLSASLSNHLQTLPDLCATAKFNVIDAPEREVLVNAWKQWMEEHITSTGKVPPGNETGVTTWTKPKPLKPDIRLTPGPHVKLNIPLEELIDRVVKDNRVVAFIKGSRTAPQCGFSHKVLTILNEHGIEYESVNVLDDQYNSGLREAIKIYSHWPTIPQIYAYGEFVGGADILEELATNGKIKEVFQKSS